MRGNVLPARPTRRHRSTRRRQDAPDLPRRKVVSRTVGKTYTAPDGKTFRPSMFLTLTCPSYGRVREDGTPADPGSYDYVRAARDALHFAALFDRFMQNLRRFLGYDVQYFAAVGPQRRLAPHIHIAMRGTVSRADSPSTVLKVHRILSRALTIAVRRRRLSRNVATLVDAPSAASEEIEPLTREEAQRILKVAASRRNGARWSVALALGIRQGEALGLRWSFVDLETGTIRAWFQIQRIAWRHGCDDPQACADQWHRRPCKRGCKQHRHRPACKPGCTAKGHVCYKRPCPADCVGHGDKCPRRVGGGIVFRQRKGKGKLTLQCPPVLLHLLKEHRKDQTVERLRAGSAWTDYDLVFATRHGGPIERTEDWRSWKAILRQARVRDVRVHDARHTAATLLIEQGVHIRVVQEVLGHTRVTTTEKYTHVATLQMKDASERMGQALWGQE